MRPTPQPLRVALVLMAAGVLSSGASWTAAAACQSTCKQELVACERECSGGGKARRNCRVDCAEQSTCTAPGARIGTLAYVVSKCTAVGFHQQLKIRRGNCDPITVLDFPEPIQGVNCGLIGFLRSGVASSSIVGVFQRLGVSPGGRFIVVEVTDDFSVVGPNLLLPPGQQEGFFVVGADGSGGHWIAPASREPIFRFAVDDDSPIGVRAGLYSFLSFSPDGQAIVLTDIGPGPDGEDATQIFTLDLATGKRVQRTRLPDVGDRKEGTSGLWPGTTLPVFLSDGRISFRSYGNFDGTNAAGDVVEWLMNRDGSGLRRVPEPAGAPGRVVQNFTISSPLSRSRVTTLKLPGEAENPTVLFDGISEVFRSFGKNLLQLTNLRRSDTGDALPTRARRRVIFTASSNRLGTNPSETCQLFSIGMLGTGLRQLTRFSQPSHSVDGCNALAPPGCRIVPSMDATTGTVGFYSSCDPFGLNPFGDQIFTMRSDGGGLRQLTRAGGWDGVSSENIGPLAGGPSTP